MEVLNNSGSRIRRAIHWLYAKLGADLPTDPVGVARSDGRFPSVTQSLLWDMLPANVAPDKDGLLPPPVIDTNWIGSLEAKDLAAMLSIAQSARAARQSAVEATELKASRLLTPTVTLLAASAALAAYQLQRAGQSQNVLFASLLAVPAAFGLIFFTISALRSLDTDVRVGFYKIAVLRQDSSRTGEAFIRECLRNEVLGEYWANWTALRKKDALMQARAWFSRGLVCLVVALVIAAVTQITNVRS